MRLGLAVVLAPPRQDVEDGLSLYGGQSSPVHDGDVVLDLAGFDSGRAAPLPGHRPGGGATTPLA
jgi:hypothetical protein